MKHARAILWAQWRTLRNFYPRGGVAWTAVIGVGLVRILDAGRGRRPRA